MTANVTDDGAQRLREARWLAREGLAGVQDLHPLLQGSEPDLAARLVRDGRLQAHELQLAVERVRAAERCGFCDHPLASSAEGRRSCPQCARDPAPPASVEPSAGGAAPPRFSGGASEACDRRSDPALARDKPRLTSDALASPDRDRRLLELAIRRGLVDADAALAAQTDRREEEEHLSPLQVLVHRRRLSEADQRRLESEVDGAPAPRDDPSAPAGVPIPQFGQRLGQYEILGEIGRGGMGVIYRARDPKLRREIAVKVIKDGELADADALARFKREAEAAAALQHPNIVCVYEIDAQGRYFAMEYVAGEDLHAYLQKGPEREVCLRLLIKVARAVHHAHDHGIVHRDLKPANILVTPAGEPKVTDFGLAKQVGRDTILTRTGAAVGTPQYMPPEQLRGDNQLVDARSDVYALGVILYQMLTRQLPFAAETHIELYRLILEQDPLPPRRLDPGISIELETICLKTLRKQPDDRYQTARALAADIERHLAGEAILARPEGLLRRWRRQLARERTALRALLIVSALALLAVLPGRWLWSWRDRQRAVQQGLHYIAGLAPERTVFLERFGAQQQDVLARALDDPRAEVQRRAAQWIGDLGLRALIPALEAAATRAQGPTRLVLGDQQRRLQGRPRLAELREAAQADEPASRRYALATVPLLEEPLTWQALLPLLGDADLSAPAAQKILGLHPQAVVELRLRAQELLGSDPRAALAILGSQVAQLAPGDVDAALLTARAQESLDAFDQAVATLRAAAARTPDELRLLRALAGTTATLHSIRIDELTKRMTQAPADAALRLERAQACLEARRFQKAMEDAGVVLAGESAHAGALALVARALLGLENHAQALAFLDEHAPHGQGWSAELHQFRGIALFQLGRHHEALKELSAALAQTPGAIAHAWRAHIHEALGNLYEARADLIASTKLEPEHPVVLLLRARSYQKHGFLDQALEALNQLAAATPADPEVHRWRGQVLLDMQRHREAGEALGLSYELHPAPEVLVIQARALLGGGEEIQALTNLYAACEQRPPYLPAYLERGGYYLGKRLYADALSDFGRVAAESADPDLADQSRLQMVRTHLAQGHLDPALRELDRAEATDSFANFIGTERLASELEDLWRRRLVDPEQAAECARLLPLHPRLCAWLLEAVPSLSVRNWSAAAQALVQADPRLITELGRSALGGESAFAEAALAIAPDDPRAIINRAVLHLRAGEAEAAVAFLDRAIARAPLDACLELRAAAHSLLQHEAQAAADLASLGPEYPGRGPAQLRRARLLLFLGRFDEMSTTIASAAGDQDSAAERLELSGRLHLGAGRPEAALKDLEALAALRPQEPMAAIFRGLTLLDLQRLDEAEAEFQRARALAPDGIAVPWIALGEARLQWKRGLAADAFLRLRDLELAAPAAGPQRGSDRSAWEGDEHLILPPLPPYERPQAPHEAAGVDARRARADLGLIEVERLRRQPLLLEAHLENLADDPGRAAEAAALVRELREPLVGTLNALLLREPQSGPRRALALLDLCLRHVPDQHGPDQAVFYRLRADCHVRLKELSQAREDLVQAGRLYPEMPPEFFELQVQLASALGEHQAAATVQETLIIAHGSNLLRQYQLARLREAAGDDRGAQEAFRSVADHRPEDEAQRRAWALSLIQVGRYEEALTAIESAWTSAAAPAERTEGLWARAMALSGLGRHPEAVSLLRAVCQADPRPQPRRRLAEELARMGWRDAAAREYLRLARQEPGRGEGYGQIGVLQEELGHYDLAEEACTRALALADDPRYRLTRGTTRRKQQRGEAAREDLEAAYRGLAEPRWRAAAAYQLAAVWAGDASLRPRVLALLREALEGDEQLGVERLREDPALEVLTDDGDFQRLLAQRPAPVPIPVAPAAPLDLETHRIRAQIHRQAQRWAQALPHLRAIEEWEPRQHAYAVQIGIALRYLGQWDEALKALERAWSLAPELLGNEDGYFHHYNNVVYFARGDLDLGNPQVVGLVVERLRWACEHNLSNDTHNRSWSRFGLAECYRRLGRPEEALAELRAAQREDPAHLVNHLQFAQHFERLKDPETAAIHYRKLLEVTQGSQEESAAGLHQIARAALEKLDVPERP